MSTTPTDLQPAIDAPPGETTSSAAPARELRHRAAAALRNRWPEIRRTLPRDLAILAAAWALSRVVGMAWVQTDSVHASAALVLYGASVRPGQLAVFVYSGGQLPNYYADSPAHRLLARMGFPRPVAGPSAGKGFVKYLIGVEGDRVEVHGREVLLHTRRGSFSVGPCKERSRNGDPLLPIQPQVIPPGYTYMWAPHADALDSRYAVLGLVPVKSIIGRAVRLW
ncbi:MAG: S26 family signal peptidase [Rubrivivax sp.]